MIRRANPEIARGDYRALRTSSPRLGGFTSTWQGSSVCVLHNPGASELTVELPTVTDLRFSEISAVIGAGEAALDGTTLTLGAQTSVVLR